MATQRKPRIARGVAPVITTGDPRPIMDFDARTVSDDVAFGTESLAQVAVPEEGEETDAGEIEEMLSGSYLEIRGVRYDMPRLGPLALVIIPDAVEDLQKAYRM